MPKIKYIPNHFPKTLDTTLAKFGIIVCLYLTFALIKNLADAVTVIGRLLATFGWYAMTQAVFWPALVSLVLATIIAFILPSDSTEIIKKLILEKKSV